MKPQGIMRIFLLLYLMLTYNVDDVEGLEPVSTLAAAGIAVTGVIYAGYNKVKCHFSECCEEPWIQLDIHGLRHDLETRLHGQHVVVDAVVRSIYGHFKYPNSEKALVLSFHGTTGSGKNFVSRIIAENLYKKGMDSMYVHLFHAPSDFPHEAMVPVYQDQLRQWLRGNVSACERHLFIFDEVDKMPPVLMNAIKPFLDHYSSLQGVDFRKNIFIFLSNTGGQQISDFSLQHWKSGKKREEIQYGELEQILIRSAFNDKGGLWHSSLIDHNLVSVYIPFLPLERRHILECIKDDLLFKKLPVSTPLMNKVADDMTYAPPDLKLFSTTGCKRVYEKVNFHAMYEEI